MNRVSAAVLVIALCCLPCFGAQTKQISCEKGTGAAREKVKGFTITIEPAPGGDQLCQAEVSKNKQSVFATQAQSIRLRMFGGDMNGDKEPEVAFETDTGAEAGCCSLHVVSLGKTPGLLRTISKGRYFSVEDRDGDRIYEIWAGDAERFDGFDGLLGQLEVIPTVVVRFRGSQLGDAGAEFYYHYDSLIMRLRVALQAERMKGFLASDGKLATGSAPATEMPKLRETKGLVLALVEHYLYSGRSDQARASLNDLWPSTDVKRIWDLLLETRSRGITSQVDFSFPALPETAGCGLSAGGEGVLRAGLGGVTPPKPIRTPDPGYTETARRARLQGTTVLWVVICADGRVGPVRVQKPLGDGLDQKAIEAVRQWKFEPARKNGKPVAVQVNIEVNFRLY